MADSEGTRMPAAGPGGVLTFEEAFDGYVDLEPREQYAIRLVAEFVLVARDRPGLKAEHDELWPDERRRSDSGFEDWIAWLEAATQ